MGDSSSPMTDMAHQMKSVGGTESERLPRVVYLYTTFPKSTETFMQREIISMIEAGLRPRIFSLLGGGGEFHGLVVERFNLWRLWELIWRVPYLSVRSPRVVGRLIRGVCSRRPTSWLNFWENMLGAGFAAIYRGEFLARHPDLIHAAWSTAPATAAWILKSLDGHRYSAGAHAYDIYKKGGDWWLPEKLADAEFVHTSTQMAKDTLVSRGVSAEKIHLIRRGLATFPDLKPLRSARKPLRICCVARLVPKKGLFWQLDLYARMKSEGIVFEAQIAGEGPQRSELAAKILELGLADDVKLAGHLSQSAIASLFQWADVLIHTGVVAPNGDRDGLPNVIPEAMAAGVLVITSPEAGTREAIADGLTGRVVPVGDFAGWVAAFRQIETDTFIAEQFRANARKWTEVNFDARANASRIRQAFIDATRRP